MENLQNKKILKVRKFQAKKNNISMIQCKNKANVVQPPPPPPGTNRVKDLYRYQAFPINNA